MAKLPRDNAATFAMLERHEARQASNPGYYEWSRENGVLVRVEVSPAGLIRTWENDAPHAPVDAGSFEVACEAVEDLIGKDTIR